jgi:hypothetical protein
MTDFVNGSFKPLVKTEELTDLEYPITIKSMFYGSHQCKKVGSKYYSSDGYVAVLYICGHSSGWPNSLRFFPRVIEEVSKPEFRTKYRHNRDLQKNYLEFMQIILDEYRHSSEKDIIESIEYLIESDSYIAFSELSIAFIPIGSKFRILHNECGGEHIDIFTPELFNLTA